MADRSGKQRFFTSPWAWGLAAVALGVGGVLLASIIMFRAPYADDVTVDRDGKLVGYFHHERGGVTFKAGWPFVILKGVLSHGTGGACLLAGISDPATGLPATCATEDECDGKFPPSMTGWFPYCAPEGTCWARRATPGEKKDYKLPDVTPTFQSCNRSHDPLDPTWYVEPVESVPNGAARGPSLVLYEKYPSNAPMEPAPSKRWRVVACVNGLLPANMEWDARGCSGRQHWGKVLTLP